MNDFNQEQFVSNLKNFKSCFIRESRDKDSVDRGMSANYYTLREGSDEKWRDLVRSLHMDELPNDWRWQITHELVCAIEDYTEERTEGGDLEDLEEYEVLEALQEDIRCNNWGVQCSNYELFRWLSDYPARGEFEDPSAVYRCLMDYDDSCDIGWLAQERQREEIQIMAGQLIHELVQMHPKEKIVA